MGKHERNPKKPEKGWHYRPPRRRMNDATLRRFSIRRDGTGWSIIDAAGEIVASGLPTDTAAADWVRSIG